MMCIGCRPSPRRSARGPRPSARSSARGHRVQVLRLTSSARGSAGGPLRVRAEDGHGCTASASCTEP
eukprot:10793024-Lingulodinium_polyedra.AAC.1